MHKATTRAALMVVLVSLTLTGCAATDYTDAERGFLDRIAAVDLDRDDAALIAAGHAACEQVQGGRNVSQVRVFNGDPYEGGYYRDSLPVAIAAVSELCP